jgi:DNA polymerase-4
MQVREALRLCPDLQLIRPDFNLYRQFSVNFMKIAYQYSPLVEPVSIDECYVDITGSKQFGTPLEIAEALQRRIKVELGLPCSIGVAPNKLLAKVASDLRKPDAINVLRLRDVPAVLWDKPCNMMFGIGKKTADKLQRLQIYTLGQLAAADERLLTERFGVYGAWLKRAANGHDDAPVNPDQERSKSIGHTTTLPRDFTDKGDVRRVFLNLADQVARRLRRQKLLAQTVQITLREPSMKTYTRSVTLPVPTESHEDVYREACRLFDAHWPAGEPVRLLGITLQNLQPKASSAVQLDLFTFENEPKKERLSEAMDRIRDKFGESAILTAGMMSDDPSAMIRNHKERGTSLQKDYLKNGRIEREEE